MVTFGTPHEGTGKLPNCFSGVICGVLNWIANQFVYFDIVQRNFGPAGYFRDPTHINRYEKYSHFLPSLNNDLSHKGENSLHRERIMSLNKIFLGMFEFDSMVYPPSTAIFSQW